MSVWQNKRNLQIFITAAAAGLLHVIIFNTIWQHLGNHIRRWRVRGNDPRVIFSHPLVPTMVLLFPVASTNQAAALSADTELWCTTRPQNIRTAEHTYSRTNVEQTYSRTNLQQNKRTAEQQNKRTAEQTYSRTTEQNNTPPPLRRGGGGLLPHSFCSASRLGRGHEEWPGFCSQENRRVKAENEMRRWEESVIRWRDEQTENRRMGWRDRV